MEQSELLLIINDGLNEKQSKFIASFAKTYGFKPEYIVFDNDEISSEVNAFRIAMEKSEQYENEKKKKPHFLFAVEHGTYFITRTIEKYGIQNIIHIDQQGVRFAY